jgi:hypothetical protein
MLSVIYAECHKQALYAECPHAKCHYPEFPYAECHYAEFFMLHAIMLSVLMLSVIYTECHK